MGLERHWYRKDAVSWLLLPIGWMFCALTTVRRLCYRLGLKKSSTLAVPVIVVGNISVGGTGKTPLVAWLVKLLRGQGWRPGIVSRGYRGRASTWPQQVRPDSDPRTVGDEAVMLAQICECPVAAGPDRVQTASALLEYSGCDIIVSDDGLQHYALARDIELAVIDGIRRFGNGWCLPAGPLREPRSRLQSVDFIVCNGIPSRGEYAMRLRGDSAIALLQGETRPLRDFAGKPVHAVAGIGHPERFFSMLEKAGLEILRHPFADHYAFEAGDLAFGDDLPVLMTAKDAVKCHRFADARMWSVPVSAEIDEHLQSALLRRLQHITDR